MGRKEGDEYRLQDNGRYCHVDSYVESCLSNVGFQMMAKETTAIRMEAIRSVVGLLFVARLEEGCDK